MLELKIFAQLQTFRRRPFVPSHNFCHPARDGDYLAGQTDGGKLAKSPLAEEILTHISRDFPRGAGEDKVMRLKIIVLNLKS